MTKALVALGLLMIGLVVWFGLFLLWKGARNIERSVASKQWPKAGGVVVASETTRDVTKGARRTRTAASVTFRTRTVIRYSAAGHEYTTDLLHFGQTLGSGDKSEAELQRLRWPSGAAVTIAYDPRDPSVAVLKPGLHADAFWLAGAGLAFLIPAGLALLAGRSILHPGRRGDRTMGIVAVIFGAVACGLGVLAFTAGIERIWHGTASRSWPTTNGTVIFARKGGGEGGSDAPDDTTDAAYFARFVYRYEVAGVTHFNNLRRFAQVEGGSSEEAERLENRYRQGAPVTVSYLPADPDIAVLEPGNTGAAFILPGIGLVLMLFSAATFLWVVPALSPTAESAI